MKDKTLFFAFLASQLLLVWPCLVVSGFIYPMLLLWGILAYAIMDEPGFRGWRCRRARRVYERLAANETCHFFTDNPGA